MSESRPVSDDLPTVPERVLARHATACEQLVGARAELAAAQARVDHLVRQNYSAAGPGIVQYYDEGVLVQAKDPGAKRRTSVGSTFSPEEDLLHQANQPFPPPFPDLSLPDEEAVEWLEHLGFVRSGKLRRRAVSIARGLREWLGGR